MNRVRNALATVLFAAGVFLISLWLFRFVFRMLFRLATFSALVVVAVALFVLASKLRRP